MGTVFKLGDSECAGLEPADSDCDGLRANLGPKSSGAYGRPVYSLPCTDLRLTAPDRGGQLANRKFPAAEMGGF